MNTNPHRKMYVLDTSVLLSTPHAMRTFAEHEVVIPLVVIKELESKRHDPNLGYPARVALRALEELRNIGDMRTGVPVNDAGGTVRIEINHVNQSGLPDAMRRDTTHDTRILAVANAFKNEGRDVVVVSKDMPMRILADTLGLGAEEYRNEMVVVDRPYTGVEEFHVPADFINDLHHGRPLRVEDLDMYPDHNEGRWGSDVPVNTGLHLLGPNSSALARIKADKTIELVRGDIDAFGVKGRTAEQRIALAHLTDPDTHVVSLGGLAGAGKTYLALAAALEAVVEQRTHDKVMVFRPLYSVGGQDLGFLPGTAEEKMGPWGAAVFDALSSMVSKEVVDHVMAENLLEVQPLTFIRGRSLSNAYIVLDEAQNLERSVLLTALTRLGEGSKIAISWDASQRDNLRVGRFDGIAALVERLKGESLFAHVTMTKSERGPVAAMATRLLDDFGG